MKPLIGNKARMQYTVTISLFPLSRTLLPQAVEEGEGESQQEEDEEVKRNKEQK